MKKIYALFMTLCLIISATAAPLAGTVKGSYPLNTKVVTSAKQLSLDATMQKAPAATQGLQYDATEGELIRYYNESDALSIDTTYASEGQLSIRIVASDNSDLLSLVLFAEDTVPGTIIPEGTYPITSEPAYGTAYASPGVQNGSVYPSFYGMLNANGQILTPLYFLESGNVVVEVVDGNLKISIDAANSNEVPMTIVYEVGGKSEKVEVKAPLKYDATEGELDVTYGVDATVELTNGNGYSILTVAAADATNEVDLAFFYDAADPETVIPVGTYTIDGTYASGTVLASSGVNSQGQVSLSFYANLNASGQLVTPIYFLVDGTVEVTKVDGKLKVEVNAVNSNNVPIHIVYDATPAEPAVEVMELTMTNLQVSNYGEATGLWASDTDNGIEVMLFLDAEGNLMAESSIMVSWMDYNVTGTVTKAYNEELATDVYTAELYTTVGETNYKLIITMYSAPVVATPVVVENAEIDDQTEETGFMYMTGVWTDAEGVVYPVKAEVPGFDITVAEAVYKNVTVTVGGMGDEDPWLGFVQGDATITVAENVVTLTGAMSSWDGLNLDVTISGTLPVVEDPEVEKPEPTYTENKLNPYAFGLESVLSDDQETLTVTYRLNNSNATEVNVVVYNGTEVVATVPGTTTIGKNTVEVATAGLPGGVELTWGIEVNGTSVEAPTLEEKIYSFYHPSGLDIDNNPENATFGMLLINEGMQSVASKTEGYVSAGFGAGIFAFTPSFDLIPNGELPGYKGGVDFTTGRYDAPGSTAYAPRRIRISEDGRIFVTSLNTDGNYLWEVNPANLDEWTAVFKGAKLNEQAELLTEDSAFIAAPNNGFDVKGSGENLQLAMYSVNLSGITAAAMGGFRLHEYNLGTATEWTTVPSKALVEGKYAINYVGTQVEYDNEGGYWIASYRGEASDANPGLVHINADGVEDLKLVWSNVRQAGIRFNNDFTKLVVAGNNGAAKKATIYTISKDANGAPVLTQETVVDMTAVGNNLNDFAWDYAGNLYACGNSSEKLAAWAMPYSGTVETPAATQYAFQLPEPIEMVGTVKRAVQNGEEVIVLTHEEDGTAHIYQVVNGKARVEISQEGVVPVDPENKGSYLAISDIAVTEDGKLVANNYVRNQFAGTAPESGYKEGTSYYYIWNDLAGAPAVWFTSQTTARSSHGDVGVTFALKGTSTNAEVLVTAVHNNNRAVRLAKYNIIDGQYVEPNIPGGEQSNAHYEYYGLHTTAAYYKEATQGTQFQLSVSPLGDNNWIMDGELVDPSEFVLPAIGEAYEASAVLNEDLGKKYNGASYVTVGEKVLMVAPYATPEGKLTGVEILDITGGLDAAQYVDQLFIDEAVEATAAATAVEVVEGDEATALLITLVADATIYSLEATLSNGPDIQIYEDEITNLVIDLDNLVLIGGPSTAFQVDVYLGLGDYNRNDGTYQLLPESSVALFGTDATFVEGYAYEVDAFTPSAKAVVRCVWNGMNIELHLTMTAEPMEATVVVVENATVEIEKYLLFGDMYDYALKMTGEWVNPEDGLTYPVLVEVPVYYPEATEPSEIMSTVTVGGWGDNDPWLGFGEGTLTVTTVGDIVTATGIVQNPLAGVAIDITISGTITSTGLENATVTVKSVKMIKNGQLIIEKGDVQYNALGQEIK